MAKKRKSKSYVGQPYHGSNRSARIYRSVKSAANAVKRKGKKGTIYQLGKGKQYVVQYKGQKYYSK